MATLEERVAKGRAAGFTDQEIFQALEPERLKAKEAGFTDEETFAAMGLKAEEPVQVPGAFVQRLDAFKEKEGLFTKLVTEVSKGAKEGFGEQPLGFEPGSEAEKFFDTHFMTGGGAGPVRLVNEALLRPTAAAADALGRAFKAGAYGIGGAAGVLAEELGASQGDASRIKRDVGGLIELSLMFAGTGQGTFVRVTKDPVTRVVRDEPVGALPKSTDFQAAAKVATEGEESPRVLGKMADLWKERGVHPAEVVEDIRTDPVTKQELLSQGNTMPERYGGRELETKAGAGGGGKGPPFDDATPLMDDPKRIGGPGEKPIDADATFNLERDQAAIRSRLSIGEPDPSRKLTWERFYSYSVDKLWRIFKDTEQAVAETGRVMETADDPYRLGRLYSGWASKAKLMLEDQTFDFFGYQKTGDGLGKILKDVKGDVEGFRIFAAAARAAELEKRGIEHGFDMGAVRRVVENQKGTYGETFKKLVDYQNNVAQYLKDAGVLSERGFKAMMEANQLYVPFHRLLNTEGLGIAGVGGDLQARNPIKAITGSTKLVVDPLENVIKNTYLLVSMAEKNRVGQKLVEMLEGMDMGVEAAHRVMGSQIVMRRSPETGAMLPILQRVERTAKADDLDAGIADSLKRWGLKDAPADLVDALRSVVHPVGQDEISVFHNGKREVYRTDVDTARAMKNLDAETVDMVTRLLAIPTATLRSGAVLNIAFDLRHVFRDFFYAVTTFSKEGVFTPMDMARGLTGQIMKDKDFHDWIKGGGGDVSLVALDRVYLQHKLDSLTSDAGLFTRAWNVVIDPQATWLEKGKAVLGLPYKMVDRGVIHPLQVVTELAFNASHLGAFKKVRRMQEAGGKEEILTGGPVPMMSPADRMRLRDRGWTDAQIERRQQLAPLNETMPGEYKGETLHMRGDRTSAEGTKAYTDAIFRELSDSAEKKQILDAAWVSRETSVDAARIGSKMKALNMISAFLNAKVQDTDRITRLLATGTAQERASAALKIGAFVTAPSVLLWMVNRDDSRYQNLPDWQKNAFWIVLTDRWEQATPEMAAARPADQIRIRNGVLEVNNGNIFRLPKPFSMGVVFGSGPERLLDKYVKEKPDAFKNYGHAIMEATVGDLVPTGIAPMVEQAMNRSIMSGRTIIPHHLEGQLPEYQYTGYTTELAKLLGRTFGAMPGVKSWSLDQEHPFLGGAARAMSSPMLIENYVRGFTGTLGQDAFKAVDYAMRKVGLLPDPIKPTGSLADIPVVAAFSVRHPTASAQVIQDFHDELHHLKVFTRTFEARAKEGDIEGMQRLVEMGGPEIMAKLDTFGKAISQHHQMISNIYKLTEAGEIPPPEARQLIDRMYFNMVRVAQLGQKTIHDLKKALNE